MTREIKFRGWFQNLGQMLPVERVDITAGQMVILTKNVPKKIRSGAQLSKQDEAKYWYGANGGGNELMQFTGLKDKTGKEIYEGDVMKVNYGGDDEIREIKWFGEEGYPAFDFEGNETETNLLSVCTQGLDTELFEVIGNIYENPELLTANAN